MHQVSSWVSSQTVPHLMGSLWVRCYHNLVPNNLRYSVPFLFLISSFHKNSTTGKRNVSLHTICRNTQAERQNQTDTSHVQHFQICKKHTMYIMFVPSSIA